ncbi:MAG: hypothetical protein ACI4I6_03320 [Hominimerdicola sp.]
MDNIPIRTLRADEIECRIGTISDKGLSLLLYKDARADMKILDESFGCLGWKRTHQSIDGNLYCTVEIWDKDKKEWIAKQDVGTESFTEKEKGQASDSFKRACVSVGIGRELYSAPFIWVSSEKCCIQKRNDRFVCYDRFYVSRIEYNSAREIIGIDIANAQNGKKVYSKNLQNNYIMEELERELERTGVSIEAVLERYNAASIYDMPSDILENAVKSLKKTKNKSA